MSLKKVAMYKLYIKIIFDFVIAFLIMLFLLPLIIIITIMILIQNKENPFSFKIARGKILQDDTLRNRLQSNSRRMIVERYEQTLLWEALLKEYQNLIAKNN